MVPGKHRCLCKPSSEEELVETSSEGLKRWSMMAVPIASAIFPILLVHIVRGNFLMQLSSGHVQEKSKCDV